ncbi:MAG TPA: UPF0164 family protein [Spirochaetia bacterium]|nr:UPF0164 family protein [Spirochaetia bacterium]
MKGAKVLSICSLLVTIAAGSWADSADFYSTWSNLLKNFADPNTGLTVFPTLLIPMGGRYEGMGTAYTAMASDGGFLESNPAASSRLSRTELSFYHHAWIADSNLEGLVYTMRFNDLGVGVAGKFLYVPFTAYNEWGVAGAQDYITESVGTLNISYNFLSGYYFSGISAGGNLKVAYRSIPAVFAANQSSMAVMADFGMQTSFNLLKFYSSRSRNFSVGAAVKNLGVTTLSDEALPQMASAGIAWSPLRPWTLAVDFNYPFMFAWQPPAESWNVAVGTNIAMTPFLSIQGGVLMKADNPRLSLGTMLELGTLNFDVNYNLDLSGQLNPLDKFSVEARLDLGDSGRGEREAHAEQLYLQGVDEFAGGNYAKAIELWKQVLVVDPKYQPAADSIRTVEKSLSLQNQLQQLSP